MRSTTWTLIAIAALGLVLAVALGIFADTIARGTVALPSTRLARTETQLAPEQADARRTTTAPRRARKPSPAKGTTTTTPTTTAEAGDDHGGTRRGRGSDDSGSGSSHSGKGSDD